MVWPRSGPGRPPGVPNKRTAALKELLDDGINEPARVEAFWARYDLEMAGDGSIPLVELAWSYAYGRPKQEIQENVSVDVKALVLEGATVDAVESMRADLLAAMERRENRALPKPSPVIALAEAPAGVYSREGGDDDNNG
jgi:hypothetical protein